MHALRMLASALVLAVAGCSAFEMNYYRDGIGSDLYRPDLPEVTRLQDDYIDFICQQANLAPPLAPGERCVLPAFTPQWTLLVQAGMNDIDRRCDHFLNWVDYHRRNDRHLTKQVADTLAAVTTIARVTGSPDRSLDVLAAAFGLGSATFENMTQRLLTMANQSTVQSVVVVNQTRYRLHLNSQVIENRPAAIHALRSYLRICMPATIETEINTNTVVAQRTGADGIAALQRDPLSNTRTVAPAQRADRAIVVTPGPKQKAVGTAGKIEPPVLSLDRAKGIQRTICVADTGDLSSSGTRTALAALKAALYFPRTSAAINSGVIEDVDQLAEISKAVGAVPSCTKAELAGGFEVGLVARFGAPGVRESIQVALDKAKLTVPQELINPSNTTVGGSIRAAVTALRKHYVGLKLVPPETTPPPKVTSIDAAMWGQIVRDNVIQ